MCCNGWDAIGWDWLCDVVRCEVMVCHAKWLCDAATYKMCCELGRAHATALPLRTTKYKSVLQSIMYHLQVLLTTLYYKVLLHTKIYSYVLHKTTRSYKVLLRTTQSNKALSTNPHRKVLQRSTMYYSVLKVLLHPLCTALRVERCNVTTTFLLERCNTFEMSSTVPKANYGMQNVM